MARKKFKQKQSARMFYKNKDHRDMVYNEEYINSIYIGKKSDVPDWKQYKHKLILGYFYGKTTHSRDNEIVLASLDVDNKYLSTEISEYPYRFDAPPTFYHSGKISSFDSSRYSFDGHDWRQLVYDIEPYNRQGYGTTALAIFDEKVIAMNAGNYGHSYVYIYNVKKYGYKSESSDKKTARYSHKANSSNSYEFDALNMRGQYESGRLVGIGYDGILVDFFRTEAKTTDPYIEKLYSLTPSGARLLYTYEYPTYSDSPRFCPQGQGISVITGGGRYVIPRHYETKTSPRMQGFYIWWADADNDTEWHRQIIIPEEPLVGSLGFSNFNFIYRGGYYYLYVRTYVVVSRVTKKFWRVFKSSNCSDWEELLVLPYVDVPFLEEDGTHGNIASCNYKKLRMIFDERQTAPTESQTYNTYIDSFYQDEFVWGHMYIDGKTNRENVEPFSMFVASTGSQMVVAYLDNMEFKASENNFAFACPTSVANSKGEVLQKGDYCLPTGENPRK